jgi:hypothetical protein
MTHADELSGRRDLTPRPALARRRAVLMSRGGVSVCAIFQRNEDKRFALHRQRGFREELEMFLKKHGHDYTPEMLD